MLGFLPRLLGRRPTKHFVAIDIGSSAAVRSFLFATESSGCRIALQKHVFELPSREEGGNLIPLIMERLGRLLTRYTRWLGRVPAEALIGIGNQFTFNETLTVRRIRERPGEPIHEHELTALLTDFRTEYCERTLGAKRYLLASVSPLSVSIDGYPVNALSRKTRGRTMELTLFATYALDGFWKALLDLRAHWGGFPLTAVSDQAAIASALISALHVPEALVIKVGAAITEVSLLDSGIIRSSGQFGLGGDAVTHAIEGGTGLDRQDAERIKRQWGHTVLPPKIASAARTAIEDAARHWLSAFSTFLRAEQHTLPAHIFLTGGGARLPTLHKVLMSSAWRQGLHLKDEVRTSVLDARDISRSLFRNSSPALAGPEEVALAAIAYRLAQE